MKIRFLTLIRELRKAGDDVLVVTPDRNPPPSYHGAKVNARRRHTAAVGTSSSTRDRVHVFQASHDL
jgi:hypothetical protein